MSTKCLFISTLPLTLFPLRSNFLAWAQNNVPVCFHGHMLPTQSEGDEVWEFQKLKESCFVELDWSCLFSRVICLYLQFWVFWNNGQRNVNKTSWGLAPKNVKLLHFCTLIDSSWRYFLFPFLFPVQAKVALSRLNCWNLSTTTYEFCVELLEICNYWKAKT